MSASGLDIVKGAMRAVNILSSGRNPTAAESEDYVEILNQFIDACNAERLLIYTINRLGPFDLTIGKQFYTVGTGGDINIPRPPRIESMSIINLNNNVQPVELPIDMLDEMAWQSIPVKNIPGPLPDKVWDDGGFPMRTLGYWTIPSVPVQTVIYGWGALTQFPNLNTKQAFPPGYLEFMRYNLAIRLDNAEITPQVMTLAMESKARIKSFNAPIITLQCDDALMLSGDNSTVYNWLADVPIYRGRG